MSTERVRCLRQQPRGKQQMSAEYGSRSEVEDSSAVVLERLHEDVTFRRERRRARRDTTCARIFRAASSVARRRRRNPSGAPTTRRRMGDRTRAARDGADPARLPDSPAARRRGADPAAQRPGVQACVDDPQRAGHGRRRLRGGVDGDRRNDAPVTRRIVHGERIAQVVFARYVALELRESARRADDRASGRLREHRQH